MNKKDEWDDMLGDGAPAASQEGIPADLARKLLELNPSLREAGEDTMSVVNRSKSGPPLPAAKATQAPTNTRIVDAIEAVRSSLAADEKKIDAELQKTKAALSGLNGQTLSRLYDWLAHNDPDLRSPVTQQTLETEKVFLAKIGFSIKGYMASQRKGAK